jgi:hypothetical protein
LVLFLIPCAYLRTVRAHYEEENYKILESSMD